MTRMFSRSDQELVEEIAELWVSRGGDSEGFPFAINAIISAIEVIETESQNEQL